jgi:hypothetical protein
MTPVWDKANKGKKQETGRPKEKKNVGKIYVRRQRNETHYEAI